MKKSAIAAGLALAVASGASWAGGIQLDPTGFGNIASSKFLSDSSLGSSFGNFLAQDILGTLAEQGAGATRTGHIYGQNSFGLDSFGISGAELTIQYNLDVLPTVTGSGNSVGEQLLFALNPAGTSTFKLFFDSTADANAAAGSGYGNGILIASTSDVTLTGPGGVAGLTETSSGTVGNLASNNTTQTIGSTGSIYLDLNFVKADLDTNYIVNDLFGLAVDLTTLNSLTTPFPAGTVASASVVGNAPTFGADAINNFHCDAASGLGVRSGQCDFLANMNTTVVIPAQRVPEPTTLALLGAGIGLAGLKARRRGKKA
jgi:hypothetical protein